MCKVLLIVIYMMLSTFGLIMIKTGTATTTFSMNLIGFTMSLDWKLLIGFFSYILSFLFWMIVISKYDLSYIYPIVTAILFVVVMVSSAIFLKESISTKQIISVIIILVGVAIAKF